MLGAIAWAAIATRTVGVVLPGVLLLYDAVQQRRLRRSTLVTVAVTGLMLLVQKLAMGIDTSYADQLAFEPGRIAGHVRRYAMALQDLWSGVLPPIADKLLLVPVVGVALVGFRECLRQPTLLEVFTPAYVAVICLWPSFQDTRFLLPVVPAMALYAGAGFVALKRRSPGVQTAAISLVVVLGVVYALDLAAREPGPVRGGPDTPAARACFAFIREQTPPGAVLLFRKPRAMALYTGRHVSAFPLEPARLWSYAQEIGAGFLVTGPVDRDWLRVLVTQASNHLTLIYRNEAFGVYRIENSGG